MFEKKDFDSLTEVFSAARAYLTTTQPTDRDVLLGVLNFETALKEKMIAVVKKSQKGAEQVKPAPEEDTKAEVVEESAN